MVDSAEKLRPRGRFMIGDASEAGLQSEKRLDRRKVRGSRSEIRRWKCCV